MARDKPEVDPIMGKPGEQIITTGSYKFGMRVIPAGVRSHIYGRSGEGENLMYKVLFRSAYSWVPASLTKSAVEKPEVASAEPAPEGIVCEFCKAGPFKTKKGLSNHQSRNKKCKKIRAKQARTQTEK